MAELSVSGLGGTLTHEVYLLDHSRSTIGHFRAGVCLADRFSAHKTPKRSNRFSQLEQIFYNDFF